MSDRPDPDAMAGFDLNALLQQAQQMQEQMVSAQEELSETTVEGTVGDGLVTVTVNGTGELVGVQIRKDSFDPSEPEDLEALIVAAFRDAKAQIEELARQKLGPLAGGLEGLGGNDDPSGGPGLPIGF